MQMSVALWEMQAGEDGHPDKRGNKTEQRAVTCTPEVQYKKQCILV
jgi:hypothetical protein